MLMELTSGRARPARYRELSAAERARRAAAIQAKKAAAARRIARAGSRRRLLGWTTRVTSVLLVLALVGYGVYTFEFQASPVPSTVVAPAPGQSASGSQTVPGQPFTTSANDPFYGKGCRELP